MDRLWWTVSALTFVAAVTPHAVVAEVVTLRCFAGTGPGDVYMLDLETRGARVVYTDSGWDGGVVTATDTHSSSRFQRRTSTGPWRSASTDSRGHLAKRSGTRLSSCSRKEIA